MITFNIKEYNIIKCLILLIVIMIVGFLILVVDRLAVTRNEVKNLRTDYENLNEKVNRIKAELIIKNNYE